MDQSIESMAIEKMKEHLLNQEQIVTTTFISKEYAIPIRQVQEIFSQFKTNTERYNCGKEMFIWTYVITGYADEEKTNYKVINVDEANMEERIKELIEVDSSVIKSVRKSDIPNEYMSCVAAPSEDYTKSTDLNRLQKSCVVAATDIGFRKKVPRVYSAQLGPSPTNDDVQRERSQTSNKKRPKSRRHRSLRKALSSTQSSQLSGTAPITKKARDNTRKKGKKPTDEEKQTH